jgi:hypothetical protein
MCQWPMTSVFHRDPLKGLSDMGKALACMVTGNSSAMSLKYDRPGIKMWFHHLCRRYNKAQPIGYTGVKVQLQGH